VCVTTLTAGYVKHTRAVGQSEELDEARYFLSVALGREE
jgi:hypothetical protein